MGNNILTKEEFMINKDKYLGEIKRGAIFVYPTDTIYGMGCIANKKDSVKKIREIKNRHERPFSVITPTVNWLKEHLIFKENHERHINKLKRQHTLIFEPKSKESKEISKIVANEESLGIRMINHWFQEIVKELKSPIVTTSVNKKGKTFMSKLEEIDEEIYKEVNFIIYEGEKASKPSKVLDLRKENEKLLRE